MPPFMKNNLPFFVNGAGFGIADVVEMLTVCAAKNGFTVLLATGTVYVIKCLHAGLVGFKNDVKLHHAEQMLS
jgi:hypothetical protein